MERIDDMLERLKGQMPQVPGADALTDSIMDAIEVKRVPMWVTMLRTVSSAAVVILVALFIHVNGEETASLASAGSERPVTIVNVEDACEECTLAEIYDIKREKIRKRKEREILKNRLYASYKF